MRRTRAKKLRKLAAQYVVSVMKKKYFDGWNEYHQAMNCVSWEPQLNDNGYPMFDPEGAVLLKPGFVPGTITCAWHVRVLYKKLKSRWVRARSL